MRRAYLLLPASLVLACGSSPLTPSQNTQGQQPLAAAMVADPCASFPAEDACKGAGSTCGWTAVACPANADCPAAVCATADPCAAYKDAKSCAGAAAIDARCAWTAIDTSGTTQALCPVGHDCSGGGYCWELPATSGGCGCVQPLACPKDGACPPVACDCPPPPSGTGGGSGTGTGGGTCTCSCPACAPGQACPPCACDCGPGTGGSTGAGGGYRGRRQRWIDVRHRNRQHRQRHLHLRVSVVPGRGGLPALQLQLRSVRDHDHDGRSDRRGHRVGRIDHRQRGRVGAGGIDHRFCRLQLSGLPGRRGLRAVRLHEPPRPMLDLHGREVLRGRHGRRLQLGAAGHRLLHHAVPHRDLRPHDAAG